MPVPAPEEIPLTSAGPPGSQHDGLDMEDDRPIGLKGPTRKENPSRMTSNRFKIIANPATSNTVCVWSVRPVQRPALSDSMRYVHLGAYVVVSIFDAKNGTVIERVEELRDAKQQPRDVLDAIRRATRRLRPLLFRRAFSLKAVGGFGLYECHPQEGLHTVVEISDNTKHALSELFHDYSCGNKDQNETWKTWIHANLNRGDNFPASRRLALRLLLRWSPRRILAFSFIPILLSLAIGFAYMYWDHGPDSDPVAVTSTAWTIGSYITTTTGVALAVLAAITTISDK